MLLCDVHSKTATLHTAEEAMRRMCILQVSINISLTTWYVTRHDSTRLMLLCSPAQIRCCQPACHHSQCSTHLLLCHLEAGVLTSLLWCTSCSADICAC